MQHALQITSLLIVAILILSGCETSQQPTAHEAVERLAVHLRPLMTEAEVVTALGYNPTSSEITTCEEDGHVKCGNID
jgi:hypothetical protein